MFKKINKRKLLEAEFVKAIDKYSRVDNCVLCGKKMTSACNSHVVPRFLLREIAEHGHVSYGHALHEISINGLERTTGIKNAYTFRLICNECDRKTFQDYENPINIENFDILDPNTKKKVLCEMALKTHLSHISMKYRRMITKDLPTGGKLGTLEKEGKFVFLERIDINEHEKYIEELKRFIKSNKDPFFVLLDRTLNYKTKIATQTIINYNFDLEGRQIFDSYLPVYDCEHKYFYLMIIPYKDKTHALFYIEKDYAKNVQTIVNQFNALNEEEKLHFLFISLIINDQQFYMAPSFADNIFKNDKRLVKLYSKTEKCLKYESKIKRFRKYTNYLLEEHNQ